MKYTPTPLRSSTADLAVSATQRLMMTLSSISQLKKGLAMLVVMAILSLIVAPVVYAASDKVAVRAEDTIAGYATALRSSVLTPGEQVVFRVEKPDGAVLELQATANDRGVASTDLLGFHTRLAGEYQVRAARKQSPTDFGASSIIEVYPDTTSAAHSSVMAEMESAVADGADDVLVRVLLRDKHGNPIPDHQIELISSRVEDEMYAQKSGRSDEDGVARVQVTSTKPGVSYITARDTTAGITLLERAEVVFFRSTGSSGSLLSANSFLQTNDSNTAIDSDEFGPAVRFEIDFPDAVEVNSDSNNLTITAVDSQGRIARNYTGKIILSIDNDSNATLPSGGQYTFTAADQGVKRFDLALTFRTTGTQKLTVNDITEGSISPFLSGEKFITVREACVGDSCTTAGVNEVRIESPEQDAEFSIGQLTVTGQARPNINLVIKVDGENRGIVEVGPNGKYSTTVQNITEGEHVLQLVEQANGDERSREISFRVDSTAPTLTELSVSPDGVIAGGSIVDIVILSEPRLEQVNVRIGGLIEDAVESDDTPGTYRTQITVPQTPGQYPLTARLVDTLGNTTERNDIRVLQVGQADVLPTVEGITVETKSEAIDLTWDMLDDPKVKSYRVLLGMDEFFLETAAEVAADQSSVQLSDLTPNTQYYLTVVAVDDQGRSGLQKTPVGAFTAPLTSPNEFMYQIIGGRLLELSWQAYPKETSGYRVELALSPNGKGQSIALPNAARSYSFEDLIPEVPYYVNIIALDENNQPFADNYGEKRIVMPARSNVELPALPPELDNTTDTTVTVDNDSGRTPVIDQVIDGGGITSTTDTGPAGMIYVLLATLVSATGILTVRRRLRLRRS